MDTNVYICCSNSQFSCRFAMNLKEIKYLFAYTLPLTVYVSLSQLGNWSFLTLIYSFGLIPLLELLFTGTSENDSSEIEEEKKGKPYFDILLWLNVPIQYGLLGYYLYSVTYRQMTGAELLGATAAMGICCGVVGINVAHELGHRHNRFEQFLSKILLLTSLYMHFFIEHNRGHHKHVSTPQDPATSRFGENIYAFWFRSVKDGFFSACKIEAQALQKKGYSVWSFRNQMIQYSIIQLLFIAAIGFVFGLKALVLFLVVSLIGILLLESVNYVEHYGLVRTEIQPGIYERVMPHHSWNSNHTLGRIVLYELTRHSDHHYYASREYQTLRHFDNSPQLPTGYPGMILLALFPPFWFRVMNPEVKQIMKNAA